FGWFDPKHLGWLSRFMAKVPVFPIPGHGRYMRQPLYERDFCRCIAKCIETQPDGAAYDVCGDTRIDYVDIIRTIKRAKGLRTPVVHIPYWLFKALLKIYALFSRKPPFTAAQLDALTADLVKSGFDRKHLIRSVMNSRVYQSSGRKNATNVNDVKYFSRYVPRRLGAEALLDAVCDATGAPESFKGFPAGTRAVQLPDGEFPYPFLRVFGRPPRASACECERDTDTTLHMALMLQGGNFLQEKLAAPTGRVAALAASKLTDREALDELFLLTLSRRPTAAEVEKLLDFLAKGEQRSRRQRFEDVMHALLNHPEFLFQH
ncbi:MAG: DUF1553 domain-containing protein, partial [Planctomycetes bacterium]|nr:DUF1553 domain-containing protein [Planctomycetota bacterium]